MSRRPSFRVPFRGIRLPKKAQEPDLERNWDAIENHGPHGSGNAWTRFAAGRWYGTPFVEIVTGVPGGDDLELSPLFVDQAITVTRIGARIRVAGAAGRTLRLGVYADDGTGLPAGLLLDAGTIPADATGFQWIVVSLALPVGVYWLGAVAQGAGAGPNVTRNGSSQTSMMAPPIGMDSDVFGADGGEIGYAHGGVAGALPATLTGQAIAERTSVTRVVVSP